MIGLIREKAAELSKLIAGLETVDEKIDALNEVRALLHEASPLDHPADNVQWKKVAEVKGNDYNPNHVAPPELKLLRKSVDKFGFTMPIVACRVNGVLQIVDGFHRHLVGQYKEIMKSTFGRVPVTEMRKNQQEFPNLVSSTVLHNRARGEHSVVGMKDLVVKLKLECDMSDKWFFDNLGIDADELLKLTQVAGIARMVSGKDFSKSWKPGKNDNLKQGEY